MLLQAFKNVFTNYKKYVVPAKQQGHHIRTNFSKDKMRELVGNILEHNIPEFPKQVDLNLPTLNPKTKVELPKIN